MNPLVSRKKLGRPCSVDPGETRKRLILEARRLFAEIGYDATTNRLVADAVGITTGAIYHYFPSKKDLYIAAFAEVQDMVYGALETAVAGHAKSIESRNNADLLPIFVDQTHLRNTNAFVDPVFVL